MSSSVLPSVAVMGSANVDLVVFMDTFPSVGATIHGTRFLQCFGGKGGNQCVAAARLSEKGKTAKVSFLGSVGADGFGQQYRASLEREGVLPLLATAPEGVSTGIASIFVATSTGDNQIVTVAGANNCVTPEQLRADEASAVIKGSTVLLCQLETTQKATQAALELAQAGGSVAILTPAPVDPKEGISKDVLKQVDILVPNRIECLTLGILLEDGGSAEAAASQLDIEKQRQAEGKKEKIGRMIDYARKLLTDGGVRQSVLVTCGSGGVLIVSRDEASFIPSVKPPKVIDTTGAGDAFCGSFGFFLAHLLHSRGLKKADHALLAEAARRAMVFAADSVTKEGTQPSYATRAELPNLLFEGLPCAESAASAGAASSKHWAEGLPLPPVSAADLEIEV
jgi:ribokinase